MPDTPADRAAAYLAEARKRWEVFGEADSLPALLAAVEIALARHTRSENRVTVRHLCGPHAAMGWPGRSAGREMIDTCPACIIRQKYVCVTCRHECPDDDEWPCKTYQAITTALLGEVPADDV